MGHSAGGITADMLQHVSRFFLTEATLKAVNAVVVNFHHRMGFSGLWGAGSTSSSDGQRFAFKPVLYRRRSTRATSAITSGPSRCIRGYSLLSSGF
jgi:TnpA family transposase